MSKQSLPSIEEFAAYLDGNLPQETMQQFLQMAEHDEAFQQLLYASSFVDQNIADFSEADLQLPDEICGSDFQLPEIDEIDTFLLLGDSFHEKDSLYLQDGIDADEILQQNSQIKDIREMANGYRTYGEFGENTYDPIYIKQPDDHSCALRSQQIILRDFGIDIPFEELEKYALDAGVYTENGTYTYDIGKVLEMAGVGMHQVPGSTIYDLTNELAQGHRVIVSVDADELWHNDTMKGRIANWMNDVFGQQGGNHALIVAGVEVNPANPNDVKVVLTDPGAGHLRIEYPLDQFMDAWQDSNCFMAATDIAAPYQYDASTGMEVPSNFAVEHHFNEFVVDNGYQLKPDMINIPVGYQPTILGHLDIDAFHFHESEPFQDLLGGDESAGGIGYILTGTIDDDGFGLLGETTGSVGVNNHTTPIDAIDDISGFHIGD